MTLPRAALHRNLFMVRAETSGVAKRSGKIRSWPAKGAALADRVNRPVMPHSAGGNFGAIPEMVLPLIIYYHNFTCTIR